MRLTKLIATAALPGLIASPVIAANPAASLSLSGAAVQSEPPASAPVPAVDAASSGFVSAPLVLAGVALALVIVAAVALGSNHHDSTPASA
jgi:hypothetical protein